MERSFSAVLRRGHARRQDNSVSPILSFRSLHPATDGYPLALLPIGNKPLLTYQLEYLERNSISKIIVVIEKRFMAKLDKYFNSYYKPLNQTTEIELVAISDEEESGNVLKMIKDRITVRRRNVNCCRKTS